MLIFYKHMLYNVQFVTEPCQTFTRLQLDEVTDIELSDGEVVRAVYYKPLGCRFESDSYSSFGHKFL